MELFFFLLLFLEPSWTHPLAGLIEIELLSITVKIKKLNIH